MCVCVTVILSFETATENCCCIVREAAAAAAARLACLRHQTTPTVLQLLSVSQMAVITVTCCLQSLHTHTHTLTAQPCLTVYMKYYVHI